MNYISPRGTSYYKKTFFPQAGDLITCLEVSDCEPPMAFHQEVTTQVSQGGVVANFPFFLNFPNTSCDILDRFPASLD